MFRGYDILGGVGRDCDDEEATLGEEGLATEWTSLWLLVVLWERGILEVDLRLRLSIKPGDVGVVYVRCTMLVLGCMRCWCRCIYGDSTQ